MRAVVLLIPLLVGLATESLSAPAPQNPEPKKKVTLELRLKAVAAKVKSPQDARWEAVLVNRGKAAVTLVQPGDGSDCGWRSPIVEWVVGGKVPGALDVIEGAVDRKKGDKDEPAAKKPGLTPACLKPNARRGMRCGNINALKAKEVFVLKPGEQVKLNEWIGRPSLVARGKVKVALRYFHIPDLKWKGLPLGQHDAKALAALKAAPAVTLESNEVEIEVE